MQYKDILNGYDIDNKSCEVVHICRVVLNSGMVLMRGPTVTEITIHFSILYVAFESVFTEFQ